MASLDWKKDYSRDLNFENSMEFQSSHCFLVERFLGTHGPNGEKNLRENFGKSNNKFRRIKYNFERCSYAVINSRPLNYLSEDPYDLTPLTPSMFLKDIPTVGVPDPGNTH
ncbi:hypothetical protein TNIN_449911 [Trichonephila inaurata madagascariensis]|uniref:Uncharacterized protein n=1 Tax=Trichonephila inaurata madagascariensis TaxID=2747483 RepID=A0A8X7C0P7_9ARAC|nr:hypothetical protein TNIN_449911 [Trichonephila inaurata madagascariensis]